MRLNTQRANQSKALILTGPTGVGKTALISKFLSKGFEIINADSIQVYRDLDIGSAKPSLREREEVTYHLIDFIDPRDSYTSGEFVKDAKALMKEIEMRGNIPVISGGTIYYLKELLYSPSKAPVADLALREKLKKEINERGNAWAYEELKKCDPISANRIHINDTYRLERALEVYLSSSRPLSSFALSSERSDNGAFLVIALVRDKDELNKRIERRVDLMFEMGLYDEVKGLFSKGADSSWGAMKAIGYKEFLGLMDGEMSIESLKDEIKLHTRQYAKRQMTFLRSIEGVRFIDAEDEDGLLHELRRSLGECWNQL